MAESATKDQATAVSIHPEIFVTDPQGNQRLAGTRCRKCGRYFFPRRTVCAKCLSSETETVPLSHRAVLYTFTIVHQSTPEFKTPYVLGYADLPEGVRLLAPLADIEIDRVQIGMPLELRVEPVRTDTEGRVVVGYRWHPAAEVPHG